MENKEYPKTGIAVMIMKDGKVLLASARARTARETSLFREESWNGGNHLKIAQKGKSGKKLA